MIYKVNKLEASSVFNRHQLLLFEFNFVFQQNAKEISPQNAKYLLIMLSPQNAMYLLKMQSTQNAIYSKCYLPKMLSTKIAIFSKC